MSNAPDNLVPFNPAAPRTPKDGGGGAPPGDGDSGGGESEDLRLAKLPTNDLGLADRLLARFGHDLAVCKETGWAAWDGMRFDFEHGDSIARRRAHDVARLMISKEYPAFKAQPIPAAYIAEPEEWEKVLKGFWRKADSAGNAGKTKAMLEQAEVYSYRDLDEFDARHDLMTCANGTLCLEPHAVTLKPHDRADLCTKVTGATYDPDAKCPQFEAHMEKVQPDPAMRRFVQRCLGYALMGGNREQVFLLFQGKGGDGKSTTLMAVRKALGEYVATAGIETFLYQERKSGSGPSPDVARLSTGVRMVLASEPEQGARLSGSMLKTVSGGEPIAARHLQRGFFEFCPQWMLIISCNRKPRIMGDDDGIWRRTVVVPWSVQITREERDKSINEKLAGEANGILNWLIDGYHDYAERDGLDPPQAVIDAQEDYRKTSNPFGEWYEDRTVSEKGASTNRPGVYQDYKKWCEDNEVEAMSARALYPILSDRGHPGKKTKGEWVLLNIRLKDARDL
ncbi:MAG: hypothetical protein COB49_01880 [Alphaproteobacteria bacterium]|nr:MAG: hypothetical protein COB49_01880 [Alphaproteobacteria bacterium]